ncbi:MAG: protein kinase [Anaerolineae bacterium]|nr:protein kinase [Anaerolineae bacterium]
MPEAMIDHRYRIVRKLGEGGMGTVYLALDERLEREVALKRLHVMGVMESQREQFIQRFQREAKAMARFSHPNIVHVYDYGQDSQGVYLVLEYMPNGTLKQHLGQAHPPVEAARLLLPIAEALHYIHQRGMIHRDVKPANILFDEMRTPKLADFGIVKLLDQEGVTLTATGVGVGTPDYMAPEQIGKDFDHHVDQYALGIIFYELVTGKKPYQGDTPIQTLLMHVTEPLPDPRILVPDLAENACALIRTALEKKPAQRYPDTGAFIASLRGVIGDSGAYPAPAPAAGAVPQPTAAAPEPPSKRELPFDLPPEPQAPAAEEEPTALADFVPAEEPTAIAVEEDATALAGFDAQEELTALNDIVLREEPTVIAVEEDATALADYTPVEHAAPQPPPRAAQAGPKKKFPWLWAGIGAAVVALVLFAVFVLPGWFESPPQVPTAAGLSQQDINRTKVAEVNQGQQSAAEEQNPAEAEVVSGTERRGGWLDEIVIVYASREDAIARTAAGELQLSSLAYDQPFQFYEISGSNLEPLIYTNRVYELTINPAGNPTFKGSGALNPFSSPDIRRALNFLIDREFIAQEIFGGLAQPRWVPVPRNTRDDWQFDRLRELEDTYRYQPDLAGEIITKEMQRLGAERVGGTWHYQGEPLVLVFLIRDDSNGLRVPLGDYIAGQLESVGFQVERRYLGGAEAQELWLYGDPREGAWHLYTGAWNNDDWIRDAGPDFQFYSSDVSEYAGFSPLWQSYTQVNPEYDLAANLLAQREYTSVKQRDSLMDDAIRYYNDAPYRLFLAEGQAAQAASPAVRAALDPLAGVFDLPLWALTLRYKEQEGGTLTLGMPDMFCDLVTAVEADCAGDRQWLHAINSGGMVYNPVLQLPVPYRVESAVITAVEGVPIRPDESGVQLNFTDVIEVPPEAWVDWDLKANQFITAAQAFPEGRTVAVKSTVTYPADLYQAVTWHDGSPFSAADVVFHLIYQLYRSHPDADGYDPFAPNPHDGGIVAWRIKSTDPLTIEVYRDLWELDAANNVVDLWPDYGASEAPWHVITVANWADLQGFSAISRGRMEQAGIDTPMSWLNPENSAPIRELLQQEFDSAYIPYFETMVNFTNEEEARARYENLMRFYDQHGHLFVGTGAYLLAQYELYGYLSLAPHPAYPDPADRWEWAVP